MPSILKLANKEYRWQQSAEGLPIARLIDLGGIAWIAVCPLCGAMHQQPGYNAGAVVEPSCVVSPAVYANVKREWQRRFPQSGEFSRVLLSEIKALEGEQMYAAKNSMEFE